MVMNCLQFQFCNAHQNMSTIGHGYSARPSTGCPTPFLLKLHLSKCQAARDRNQITQPLPRGLQPELMPKHVAVIMDGNRRWAENRGLPAELGHRAGGQALKHLAINCKKLGVQVLTVFAFSTDNWSRPEEEVGFLYRLFEETLESNLKELMQHDVGVSILGNRCRLPESLQKQVPFVEEQDKDNKGTRLVIALNYSGRYDITQAAKEIARKVRDNVVEVGQVNETLVQAHLATNRLGEVSNPDLLIRTSGELRVSNFMLWQLAYTELLFVEKLFPDFDEADLVQALAAFQRRQRRYGGGAAHRR